MKKVEDAKVEKITAEELEKLQGYSIYIQKADNVMPWKDFNKNMAVSVEYDLNW